MMKHLKSDCFQFSIIFQDFLMTHVVLDLKPITGPVRLAFDVLADAAAAAATMSNSID